MFGSNSSDGEAVEAGEAEVTIFACPLLLFGVFLLEIERKGVEGLDWDEEEASNGDTELGEAEEGETTC